jgi:hypothetical protein
LPVIALRLSIGKLMNWKRNERSESNETNKTGANAASVLFVGKAEGIPRNSAAQRRMFAKQAASGAANHARHHVSRRTQS